MNKYKFKIENLDCVNCANELESALQKIDVIENVSINFMMERLTFECKKEDLVIALDMIKKVIKKEEPSVRMKEI